MNDPIWSVSGAGLLIAGIAIFHVFISHFTAGGGLLLVWLERRARRENDPEFMAYVRRHSRFFLLLTLVFGAITGVGIWTTIALVQPQATSTLIQTFVWGWAIEWTLFVVEIAAALVYYYGWDRLDARTHLAVGWVIPGTVLLMVSLIWVASAASAAGVSVAGTFGGSAGFWDIVRALFAPLITGQPIGRLAARVALNGMIITVLIGLLVAIPRRTMLTRTAAVLMMTAALAVVGGLEWTLALGTVAWMVQVYVAGSAAENRRAAVEQV